MSTVVPDSDIVAEAARLLEAAHAADVPVRLIGGLAVRLHIGADTEPVFQREYKDIDLATVKGKSKQVTELMLATGYEADRQFNAMNGHRRMLFYDVANQRQVDVFVGSFEMCHEIPITERILLAQHGIPLAELLLDQVADRPAERQGSDRHPDDALPPRRHRRRSGHDQRHRGWPSCAPPTGDSGGPPR